MNICKYCNERYNNIFQSTKTCEICKGESEKIIRFLDTLEFKPNVKRVAIETILPKTYEDNALFYYPGASFKYFINKTIVEKLKKIGFIYDPINYDVKIVFNFLNFTYSFEKNRNYYYAKYYKLKNNISQMEYIPNMLSIHGLLKKYVGSDVKFHPSGREDIDAYNIAGRAFVFSTKENPLIVRKAIDKLNELGYIYVDLFGKVKKQFLKIVTDSHGDKCYRAYINVNLNKRELDEISKFFKNRTIYQKTPTRVLNRRADKVRKKFVYRIKGNSNYLDICGASGLYIKELISGDNGRTTPSISEFLKKQIMCKTLIVTYINTDVQDFYFPHFKIG